MSQALWRLLLLRFRGGVRHRARQLLSPAGIAFALLLALVVWGIFNAPSFAPGTDFRYFAPQDAEATRAAIGRYLPLGLLFAWIFNLFAATGSPFQYSQVEVDFLLAGPFRRRDLLVYKCCTFLVGLILTALIIVVLTPSHAAWPPAAFAGALLAPMFLQLSSAMLRMAGRNWAVPVPERFRRTVIAALLLIPPAVLYLTLTTGIGILDVLDHFRTSPAGGVLLMPFVVFARIFLARQFLPDLAAWAILGTFINALLLAGVICLDRMSGDHYSFEAERNARRWNRLRRGASFLASDRTAARSLRRPPYLGGMGPIVWRQSINASRNIGKVFIVLVVTAMFTGPLIANASALHQTGFALGLLYLVVGFVMPRALLCDFRGDWDNLELYRSLPVTPLRVCAGQLVMPVLLASLVQAVMVASTMLFFHGAARIAQAVLLLYLVPLNMLLYGVENFVFLMFPARILPTGRVDFEFMGRILLEFTVKTAFVVTMVTIAALIGFAALDRTGQSYPWLVATSWITLLAMALTMIPLNAYGYRRFRIDQPIAP